MALFLKKDRADILRQALAKVQQNTPVTAIGAGSIARAFVESITGEVADLYDVLDFSVAQSVISSASGRSLDLIGQLYNVQRKTVGNLAQTDRKLGSFYFYIDTSFASDIIIPAGTRVFTSGSNFAAQQLSYSISEATTIPAGRTRAYAGLTPEFDSSIYTAGINTLTQHTFLSPLGTVIRCTNPKPIIGQVAFEDDSNYRLRIIKSVRVAAAGTAEAIRFAALGVNGVRDIRVFDSTFGLGSFEIVVVPETKELDAVVAANVKTAIDKVRPLGLNLYLRHPEYLAVDIFATLFMVPQTVANMELVRRRGTVAMLRYLNTLLPGDTLIYNKLLQYIFDSSDTIQDVQITRYAPNGVEAVRKNYVPKKEQMIIPGDIEVTSA